MGGGGPPLTPDSRRPRSLGARLPTESLDLGSQRDPKWTPNDALIARWEAIPEGTLAVLRAPQGHFLAKKSRDFAGSPG